MTSRPMSGEKSTAIKPRLRLGIDVTKSLHQPFVTGVQRITWNVVANGSEAFLPFAWNLVDGSAHRIAFSQVAARDASRRSDGPLNQVLRHVFSSIARPFLSQARRKNLPKPLVRIGQKLYGLIVPRQSRFKTEIGPKIDSSLFDGILLTDVPTDHSHLSLLKNLHSEYGVKIFVYLHDLIPVSRPDLVGISTESQIRSDFENYLSVVSESNLVICNSKFTQTEFLAHLAEKNAPAPPTTVVYPPWPKSENYWNSPVQIANSPSVYEYGKSYRLLFIGPLDRRKNPTLVLRVAKMLHESDLDAEVRFVSGSPKPYDHEFFRELRKLPARLRRRIRILGQVSDASLADHYSWCTHVLYPSLIEGFGMPIVEGLAWGKPVLACKGTVAEELGKFLPVTLLDPDKPSEWADSIRSRLVLHPKVMRPKVLPASWGILVERIVKDITPLMTRAPGGLEPDLKLDPRHYFGPSDAKRPRLARDD